MDEEVKKMTVSAGKYSNLQLEGLRAFGVVLVVLSHVNILNQGGIGNAIFYCLGGFLALNPFRDNNEINYIGKQNILNYYKRRILRILPSYYLILAGVYALTAGKVMTPFQLLGCILFFNSYHHLWFLQQMMFMYLLTPLIMQLMVLLKRKIGFFESDATCFCFVLFISVILRFTLNVKYIFLPKDGSRYEFKIWQYTAGIAFGYLYRFIKADILTKKKVSSIFCGTVAAVILFAAIFSSDFFLQMVHPEFAEYYVGWQLPLICSILSGICIIALCSDDKNPVSRFLQSPPLVFIGRYSFNIYLIHYFLLPYTEGLNRFARFLIIFIISVLLSVIAEKVSDQIVYRAGNKRA